MDDITKQPYAEWLEESIATIAGIDPCCICFAATKADGTVFTGYYNADATDKAVFAHNIQSDIVMDIIKANADTISGILEDGKRFSAVKTAYHAVTSALTSNTAQ